MNVGCIPKKLMHQASLLGEAIHVSYYSLLNYVRLHNIILFYRTLKLMAGNLINLKVLRTTGLN